MPWPTLIFEVAFTTDPLNTSPAWVDMTSRLYDFEIVRGRMTSLDDSQPGEASFTLENRDRILDPLHGAGSYFGHLKAFKRVRLRATYSAVTYDLFDGFVDDDGWAQSYRPPGGAVATIRCTDGLGLLSGATLREPFRQTIENLSTQPKAWYRWDNAMLSVPDSVGNHTGSWFGEDPAAFGVAPLLQSGNAVQAVPGGVGRLGVPFATAAAGETYTVAVVFAVRGGHNGRIVSNFSHDPPGISGIDISVGSLSPPGMVWFTDGSIGGRVGTTHLSRLVDDGKPHCLIARRSGANLSLFIDGVLGGSPSGAVGGGMFRQGGLYLNLAPAYGEGSGYPWTIFDDIAIWDSALSDADCQAVSLAATSWAGDKTGERVDRLLDLAGWPSAWRDVDDGDSYIDTADYDEATALDALNECRSTEQGALFVTPGGVVRFRQRSRILTDTRHTNVQATFTDKSSALSANQYRYATGSLRVRNVIARTQVDVGWSGGTERATDIADFGATRRASIDTLLTNRADARACAGWILERHKTQRVELQSFTVNAAADNSTFPAVLGLRLEDRVRVQRFPQSVGSTISQEGLIEQIIHRASSGIEEWSTTFVVSEASLYDSGAATWGTGLWGTNEWSW